MDGILHNLGLVTRISPEAMGVPGQRHFRLLIDSPRGSACLWLEKEQLFQLGTTIQHMLATLAEKVQEGEPTPSEDMGLEDRDLSLDFKVGRLTLGHDGIGERFVLLAHDIEAKEDEVATVSCGITKVQLEKLADEALAACAAGRPPCPLCGAPKEPEAHICPRSNGHDLG